LGELLINKEVYTSRIHFLGGDFNRLPLIDQSIDVAVTILTLQHLANPQQAISEMHRVLKPKRFCLCVEPDNTSQCIHLPMYDREFSAAISAFWDAVRKHYLPRDIALGPSLPFLLSVSGYKVKNIDTFLITRYSQERAELFVQKSKNNFLYVGEKYGIRKDSSTMMTLLRALDKIEQTSHGVGAFYSLLTIPLFLVKAIKE
jgi:SAM-dependent methyltransferase